MIFLHKPYIKDNKNKSRLIFDVDIDEEKKKIWFEVDKEYKKYLCTERIDAIFIGILNYALREGHDIKSDSYITNDILFKVNEFLIPSLVKYGNLHKIKIDIKTKEALENAGGVGTGLSCGVDSMHVIFTKINLKDKDFALTHVCNNNVGAFNECYKDDIKEVRKKASWRAKSMAKDIGLPLILTDSNISEEIYQNHLLTHTYSSTFAIYCLQKLWKVYYYGSSGYDFSEFNLENNDSKDCAFYELLSLQCFSTKNLTIYSEGGALNRLEKMMDIYENELFKKYLHVCTIKKDNCSICDKCMRTILSLYALTDDLTPYKDIFDIDYFNNNKEKYFKYLYDNHLFHDKMNEPTYQKLLEKEDFRNYIAQYETKKEELSEADYYKREYEKIANSKTFKVGDTIMKIPRKLKNMIKK